MDWINIVSNNDNKVLSIYFDNKDIVVVVKMWNDIEKKLCFRNYMAITEKHCVGEIIGDILVSSNSRLLEEIEDDVLKGNGSLSEICKIRSYIFMNEWNEAVILEILAEDVDVE